MASIEQADVSLEQANRIQNAIKEGYEVLNAVNLNFKAYSDAMTRLYQSGATSHRAGQWCGEARWLYGLLHDRFIGIMNTPRNQ